MGAVRTAVAMMAGAMALSGAAWAADAPDGPMATAGASGAPPAAETGRPATTAASAPASAAPTSAPMSVGEQIDDFIRRSPAASVKDADVPDLALDERRVRGEVSVGVGSHGYRSASVRAEFPLGKSGYLTVAASQSRGPAVFGGCGYGYGSGLIGPLDEFGDVGGLYGCSPYRGLGHERIERR